MSTDYDVTSENWQRFTFEREGPVLTAYITSAHPVNGVDEAMHTELALIFNCLQRDSRSDLNVLSGKGRAFCAGGDFDWFQAQIDRPERFRAIAWDAKQIVVSLWQMEKPIVCRMNGAAAGLGGMDELLSARQHVAQQLAAANSSRRSHRRFVFSTMRGD